VSGELSRKAKTRMWFGVYFMAVLSPILVLPILKSINRAEPFIGPFPFIIFVIMMIGLLVCAGLIALFEIEDRRGDLL
jgi:hypothetical protein